MIGFRFYTSSRHVRVRPAQGTMPRAALLLTLALLLWLIACSRSTAEGPQGPPAVPVKVQRINSQELGSTSEYVATIKSRHSATIMSDVEGWIFDINVHSGDVVKKGQSLMEIDPRRDRKSTR